MFILLLLIGFIQTAGPIPNTKPGHQLGNPSAPISFELFVDLHCIDTADMFPNFLEAIEQKISGKKIKDSVDITIHQFPLPYHRNSFYASQMAYFIHQKHPESYLDYCLLQMKYLDKYNRANDSTAEEIQNWLQQDATKAIKHFDPEVQTVFSNSQYDWQTRVAWKYAISRGVYGTPIAFINRVVLDELPESVEGLVKMFQPYVKA